MALKMALKMFGEHANRPPNRLTRTVRPSSSASAPVTQQGYSIHSPLLDHRTRQSANLEKRL